MKFNDFLNKIDKKLLTLKVSHGKIFLLLMTVFLIAAHLIARFIFNMDDENGMFNLDVERNIPTVYTTLLLFLSGLFLVLISIKTHLLKKRYFLYWLLLGIIFVYLGFDEYFSIHERWMEPIRESLNTTGLLYFAWIIPYMGAVLLLGILYFKFIFSLPKKIRLRIILAGSIYVLGALIIEAFGGSYIEKMEWQKDIIYFFIITFEESFELAGLALFLYALLRYNKEYLKELPKVD